MAVCGVYRKLGSLERCDDVAQLDGSTGRVVPRWREEVVGHLVGHGSIQGLHTMCVCLVGRVGRKTWDLVQSVVFGHQSSEMEFLSVCLESGCALSLWRSILGCGLFIGGIVGVRR